MVSSIQVEFSNPQLLHFQRNSDILQPKIYRYYFQTECFLVYRTHSMSHIKMIHKNEEQEQEHERRNVPEH